MFDKIEAAFQFHKQALGLRHERQELLANNIANADTPNFKARDFDFSKAMAAAMNSAGGAVAGGRLQTTAVHHIASSGGTTAGPVDLLYRLPAQPSLDGNTVDMDQERAQFMDNSVRYQASLVLINSYIQGLKTAIQSE